MDTYTIEAGSGAVMGYGNHMFWVLKVNGNPIAEIHGFPVDENKVRIHSPTGILYVRQYANDLEMVADFGIEGPIDMREMTGLNDYMSREVYRTNSQEDVLNRWNAGANEINNINDLNSDYYFDSVNCNSVHGALGTVMGLPVQDFDPRYTPGLDRAPWLLGEMNWKANDYTHFSDGSIMYTADANGDGLIERINHYYDGTWHIGPDGDIFPVAEEIVVEGIKSGYYEIQNGDTLSEIAEMSGVSVDELMEYNYMENQDEINAGDMMFIPGDSYFDTDFTTGFGDEFSWDSGSSWDDPNNVFYDSPSEGYGDLMFWDNGYNTLFFEPITSISYEAYEIIMDFSGGGSVDLWTIDAMLSSSIFEHIGEGAFEDEDDSDAVQVRFEYNEAIGAMMMYPSVDAGSAVAIIGGGPLGEAGILPGIEADDTIMMYPSVGSEYDTGFDVELIGIGSLNEADLAQ